MHFSDLAIERAKIIEEIRLLNRKKQEIEGDVIRQLIEEGKVNLLRVNWERITPPKAMLKDILDAI